MKVQEAILKRKATKIYLQEGKPNQADIDLINDAGLWAPTPFNIQNSMVISITNPEFKKEVATYFDEANHQQIISAQALFILVGTPWKNDQVMKSMLIDHSVKYWGVDEDQMDKIGDGAVHYYNNISEYKDHLDISASGTQLGMMMIQATALGYDSNGIIGINKTEIEKFLLAKDLINEYQSVNVAFTIGHSDENHEKNKVLVHTRIDKNRLIKEIN